MHHYEKYDTRFIHPDYWGGGSMYAQTGKVGINTEDPKETLEINGTLRVGKLPESGKGKIYNGANGENPSTNFSGTRTLVADESGNIGYIEHLPHFTTISGADTSDAIPKKQRIEVPARPGDINAKAITNNLASKTFTLAKKSIVFINATVSIGKISVAGGTGEAEEVNKGIEDGHVRRLGTELYLNNNLNPILYNSFPFSNYSHSNSINGYFYSSFSKALILSAGSHTIRVEGTLFTSKQDNVGIAATFGEVDDNFDIIVFPLP